MTVKRFDFNLALGEDEHKGLIFCNGKILKTTDVVYLLKELWKENVHLNREFDRIYERIKQQKELISEQAIQLDYLKDENRHMSEVLDENKQLKQQLHNFIQLANENDKTLNELYQYMVSYFDSRHENTYWNPKNLRG